MRTTLAIISAADATQWTRVSVVGRPQSYRVWRLVQKIMSVFVDIPWAAVLPDLSTSDFFLRGYLKKCGFRHPYSYSSPSTSGRLTLNIIQGADKSLA
jgi:hypothetical protein